MNKICIGNRDVYGLDLNPQMGCLHYNSPLDIVAISFKCCQKYYACYFCHLALANHKAERWESHEWDTKAILCGHCKNELTIHQYCTCDAQCPHCQAAFNPGCKTHWNYYFSLDACQT